MERRVIAYHKAEGEVVSRNDPEGRPSAFDALPSLSGQRWVSVGRLDIATSGVLLFTNDAELANRLMHPSTELEQEYAVRVDHPVAAQQCQVMLDGVMLEDGISRFNAIIDAGSHGNHHWYRCSLVGGKFREVCRLWESQGLSLSRLVRIRFGTFAMTSALKPGTWVELDADEISALEGLCKLPAKKHTGLYGRARRLAERQERGARANPEPAASADRPRKSGYLRGRR
jgi:23S rRNA pseudouridine2605 synthase